MTDSEQLLHYIETRRGEDLAPLVKRHVDWVHACAQRQLHGDAHLAADVTQAVFLALAQKPPKLKDDGAVVGWLFGVTRYACFRAIRDESRRRRHESQAAMMRNETVKEATEMDEASWNQIAPMLDQFVAKLSESDRRSVILRFFQQRSYLELGQAMGISEEAARKRVSRAVEKLRQMLAAKGVTAPAAALSAGMLAHATPPAPAAVLGVIVHGSSAPTLTTSLAQGVIHMLKMKFAAAVAIACIIPTVGLVVLAQIAMPPRTAPPPVAAATTQPAPATQPTIADVLLVDDKGQPVAGADVYVAQRLYTRRLDATSEIDSSAGPLESDAQGLVRITSLTDVSKAASYSRNYYVQLPGQKVGVARDNFTKDDASPPVRPLRINLVNSTTVNGIVALPDGFKPTSLKARLLYANIEGLPGRPNWLSESIDGADEDFLRYWPDLFKTSIGEDLRFAITDIPADGAAGIVVEGPGLAQAQARRERFSRDIFEIQMHPQAVVTGKIIGPDGTSPASGVLLLLNPKSVTLAYRGTFTATTNERGEYRFEGLPEGVYNLVMDTTKPQDWTMQTRGGIRLETGQTLAGVDIKLESGTIVHGRAIAAQDGKPIFGATIAALSPADTDGDYLARVNTDQAGNFSMRLPTGKIHVYVMYPGNGYSSPGKKADRDIQIDEKGNVDTDLTFTMPPQKQSQKTATGTAIIRGQVVDSDGKPLPAIKIGQAEPDPFDQEGEHLSILINDAAITDAQGNFQMTVTAGVWHALKITSPDYSGKAEGVVPQPNTTVERKLVATYQPLLAQITGTIVDPQGKPIASVSINQGGPQEAVTDDQGKFTIPVRSVDRLPSVHAYKSGYETRQWGEIPLDAKDLRLVIYPTTQPGAWGTGHTPLKDPDTLLGQPAPPIQVESWLKLGPGGAMPQPGQGRATLLMLIAEDDPASVLKLQAAAAKLNAQAIAILPVWAIDSVVNRWVQDPKITAFVAIDGYVQGNEYLFNGATRISYGMVKFNHAYLIDGAGNVASVQFDLEKSK